MMRRPPPAFTGMTRVATKPRNRQSAPHDAGDERARVIELERDPERADEHEERRHVRIRRGTRACAAARSSGAARRRVASARGRSTFFPATSSVRPSAAASSAAETGATRSTTLRRFASSAVDGDALAHRLLGPLRLRPRSLAMDAGEGGGVVLHLLRHVLAGRLLDVAPARRDRVGGADVRRRVHAATCAASVMKTPAEPARAPAGPTQTRSAPGSRASRCTMSRVARAPAGRVERDGERVEALRLRAGEARRHVLGGAARDGIRSP